MIYGGGAGSQSRIDYGENQTSLVTATWVTETAQVGATLVNGTVYRIGAESNTAGNQTVVFYYSGALAISYSSQTYASPPVASATFTDTGYGNRTLSVYATYTAAGGATVRSYLPTLGVS